MLAITLRYLDPRNSYHSLTLFFRVPQNTISLFLLDVYEAIIAEYGEEVVTVPTTEDGWLELSKKFGSRWNLHNTIGAIDGQHIAIKAPKNCGSVYHNYNGFFSIILLAVLDADYKFIWVDVEANGSTSDCEVSNRCDLKASLENGTLGLPPDKDLPDDNQPILTF